jgi:hypothetical protein
MEKRTRKHTVCAFFFLSFFLLNISSRHAEIRITEHTELGENSTIKNPENMVEIPRRKRRKEKEVGAME